MYTAYVHESNTICYTVEPISEVAHLHCSLRQCMSMDSLKISLYRNSCSDVGDPETDRGRCNRDDRCLGEVTLFISLPTNSASSSLANLQTIDAWT